MSSKKGLAELLVSSNIIDLEQLDQARRDQRANGGRLTTAVVRLGFVKDAELVEFMGTQYGLPSIELSGFEVDPEAIKALSRQVCEKHMVIPVSKAGKVLVVGGTINGFDTFTSAELYDPAANGGAGAWSATGSLVDARSSHTATLLPSGKVLVVGGGGPLASAELYDPAANGGAGAWSATGSLATGRWLHTATFLPNGKVLAVVVDFSPARSSISDSYCREPSRRSGVNPEEMQEKINGGQVEVPPKYRTPRLRLT